VKLTLIVNGERHDLDVAPSTTLLAALRDDLGLTATRYGCGRGQCGACFVLADRRAVASCLLTVDQAARLEVTTVEGLAKGDELHPVQRAFVEEDAMQCGYCTSGMLISAAALLAQDQKPDEAAIRDALAGNLCRLRRVRPRDPRGSPRVRLMRERRDPERVEERIRIERDGSVTAFSGKIDFGQGIRTAFAQIVADELAVPIDRVRIVLGDTDQVPYDFGTFGSHSVAQETPLLRRAAAFARRQLIERASGKLGVTANKLDTKDGVVTDGLRRIAYAELIDGAPLTGAVPADVVLEPRSGRRYAGRPMPRLEARDIVTGRATFVADVRLEGMARGVMVRPPSRGAKLRSVDDAAARTMPGVIAVVRDGDVLGVVAEREEQARAAAAAIEPEWHAVAAEGPGADVLMRSDLGVDEKLAGATVRLVQTYVLPPIANAPIGPSAAVADVRPNAATMYVGTHRPFGVREQVAKTIGLAEDKVRVVPLITSGSYGRNSHPDAAIEAAILSKGAGRPVLVQWTREEEFAWSPSRPEAVLEVNAGLDAKGRIAAWTYEEHTNVHTAAGLDPRVLGVTSGRNAIPPYAGFPAKVTLHIEPTPLRTANFRSLAAAENVFAIESFMDELAIASKQEPLAFRLRHIDDERLRKVVERVAEVSSWSARPGDRRGRGLACTIYHDTYVAQVAEVEVAPSGAIRLVRVWCVVDPGETVNPDGVRNQLEGGIQQSASWTLKEELAHREGRVMTLGWDTYPIATFRDAPESINVEVAADETAPPTGVGEPGAVPTAAAIANAVYAACGARVRELPLTRERVREAMPS
jgi:CO/xanthine dehydrogenase Mo-binding subunit/aerobic-type carbon monoxide dehydrogenase small subunit (CoxS/CutS family)